MDKSTVTEQIRRRLQAGVLPRAIAPLTTHPGGSALGTGHIYADTAIGVVRLKPAAAKQLAAWASKLEGKGLVLVPVSAAVRSQRQS